MERISLGPYSSAVEGALHTTCTCSKTLLQEQYLFHAKQNSTRRRQWGSDQGTVLPMDILVHIHFDTLRIWSLASLSGGWGSPLCYVGLGIQCQEKSSTQMLEKHQRPKGCLFTFPSKSRGSWYASLWWSPSWVQKNTLPNTTQLHSTGSGRQAAGRWGGTASVEPPPPPPFYPPTKKQSGWCCLL